MPKPGPQDSVSKSYDEIWKHENEIYMNRMAKENDTYARVNIESRRRSQEELNRARGKPSDQN